jgi:hypothetical protein
MHNLGQLQQVLGSTPEIKHQTAVLSDVINSNDPTKLRDLPELDLTPLKSRPLGSSDIQKYQAYQREQLDQLKSGLKNGSISESEANEILKGIKEDQAIMESRIKHQ